MRCSRLRRLGADNLTLGGGVEDLFFAMENQLIESAGAAFGGNLQLARSRNDLGYALTRLAMRPLLLAAIDDLLKPSTRTAGFRAIAPANADARLYPHAAGSANDDGALCRRHSRRLGARFCPSPIRL